MQKSFGRLAMMGPLVVGILLSSNVTNAGETMKTNDTNTSKTAATGFVPPKRNPNIKYINPDLPKFKMPEFKGTRYQDTVPDTLDLTERAALAVKGLTALTDDENNAEIYWCGTINGMYHDLGDWCEYKYYAPSVLLRQACGSQERLDVEWHRMANLLQMQGTNGLFWIPNVGRPWAQSGAGYYAGGGKEQTTANWIHGRILEAAGVYYRLTGDERWKQMGDKAVAALGRLVVDRGDYAYFLQTVYSPEEAAKPQEGPVPPPIRSHGTAWVAHGLTTYYRLTQSKPALDLARKLARFYLPGKNGGLTGPNGEFYGGHEDRELKPYNEGTGHFHMNALARNAMLNAGIESGDRELIEMAQRGYAHGKKIGGDPLSGFFPEWFAGMKPTTGSCELCGVADMLFLALRQSTAGVADCWDDVDRWVRNIFVEAQLTDVAWMKSRSRPDQPKPYTTTTNLPERLQGRWCGYMTANEPVLNSTLMACCEGNSAMQLFRVWRDMLSFDSGKNRLSVHLLLNRASPWGDVYSYIPNKGLVEVKLKRDCEVAVRIPEWTQPQECKLQSGGKDVVPVWEGRYAVVKGRKGETVSFSCPIAERTEKIRIGTGDYEVVVRGSTIVEMKPGGHAYQRNDYRQPEPRMKQVERFVAEKVEMAY